jgi:3-isopropylmalate dehydrogenase
MDKKNSQISKSYQIGLIPGDGVGPEVINEGVKVIKVVGEKLKIKFDFINYDFGGEKYLKTGEVLPEQAIEEFKKLDALYLGAVGHPQVKPGILEKELLLKIRFSLDQYINLRPVVLYPGVETPLKHKKPEDINFVIIRENTEGLYCGIGGFFKKGTTEEIAIQEEVNTYKGVERCIRYAFEYTKKRASSGGKKRLTLVDKANVLTYGHDLWQRVFYSLGKEYREIEKDHQYIDACCMWMIKNPEYFDCLVTCNLFGDIITDLGAIIQGGLGVAAGANVNPEPSGVSMFEPIHGSAPKYAGKNVINPIATIVAGMLMLEVLGETEGAKMVDDAIRKVLLSGKIKSMDAGKMGMSTSEIGDLIVDYL